jgi:hypothetical protein
MLKEHRLKASPKVTQLLLLVGSALLVGWLSFAEIKPTTEGDWRLDTPSKLDQWWRENKLWAVLVLLLLTTFPILLPRVFVVAAVGFAVYSCYLTMTTYNLFFLVMGVISVVFALINLDARQRFVRRIWKRTDPTERATGDVAVTRRASALAEGTLRPAHPQAGRANSQASARASRATPMDKRSPLMIEVQRFNLQLTPKSYLADTSPSATHDLQRLRGRTAFIDYQPTSYEAGAAARLLSEHFAQLGVHVKGFERGAEIYVWIQSGSESARLGFGVLDPLRPQLACGGECLTSELPAVLSGVAARLFEHLTPIPDEEDSRP